MRNHGLTMVELLVTTCIVVVLAGLTLGSYRGAIGKAKETVCLSNLKQIYYAVSLYREDYDSLPLNNVRHPGLAPYIGEPTPVCYLAPQTGVSDWDYKLLASFDSSTSDGKKKEECVIERGGLFPLIWDFNHARRETSVRTKDPFYLIVRANGGAVRESGEKLEDFSRKLTQGGRNELPCPDLGFSFNL